MLNLSYNSCLKWGWKLLGMTRVVFWSQENNGNNDQGSVGQRRESVVSADVLKERAPDFGLKEPERRDTTNHGFIWSSSVCQQCARLKCEPGLR